MHDFLLGVELRFVPALGWALLQFIWQGLLIGCGAAFVLNVFLRGARPRTRYAVACAALLACALLPLASVVYSLARADGDGGSDFQAAANLPRLILAGTGDPGGEAGLIDAVSYMSWSALLQRQLPWIVLLWAGGAAFMSLRLGIGLLWVRQMTEACHAQPDPYWQRRLYHLARRFGISRRVRLGIVEGLDSPLTAGWWQPVVLVPAALLSGMPAELLEALLAHELAHIKRHDYLVNLLQSAIEVVLFYHPAVWWLSNCIRNEREQIADDLAIGVLGEPRRLALALSELDQFQFATPPLAHAAHGGNLMSRIKRLLRPNVEPLGWKFAVPLLGLGAACTMLYAAATPVAPVPPVPPVPAMAAVAPVPVAPPAPVSVPALSAPKALPAPPAPPAPADAPAPAAPPVTMADTGDVDSYAVVRDHGNSITVSGRMSGGEERRQVQALKQSVKGDFVLFHHAGKAYLIHDRSLLARVDEAWLPTQKFGKEMEAYNAKMHEQSKVIDALGQQMGVAAHEHGRIAEAQAQQNAALARQQAELARQSARAVAELSATATEAQREGNDRRVAALQDKIEALQAQSEKLLAGSPASQETQRTMDAISRQIEAASRPIQALGKQMEALSKQQEQVSRQAEKATRELLREALKTGKAVPAM